jgi:CubicO group peptidase (beta-lactamase class C family)
MRLFRSASAVILAFSPLSSFATPSFLKLGDAELTSRSSSAITPEISTLAQSLLAEPFLVPGVSVGVVRLGGGSVITEYGAWGNRTEEGDAADPEVRTCSPDSIRDLADAVLQMITGIGSCSKAFLASAMGILIDDFASGHNVTALPDGLRSLNWDTKLQALFPGDSIWKLEDKWSTEKANIRDLLSMVTGLTRYATLSDSHTLAPYNMFFVGMSSCILVRTRP